MLDALQPFVEFAFMRRALFGCWLLCLSSAPVGVFMVLRRISLTGDALSHAILPGVSAGYLLAGYSVVAMASGGLVAGALVALITAWSSRRTRAPKDRNLAAFYLTSLALGVFMVSIHGSSVDLMHLLFGAALGMTDAALIWIAGTATVTLWTLLLLIRPLVLDSVDSASLQQGRLGNLAETSLMLLIVLNLVAGLHAMGSLMAVGLMILPATIASHWCQRLESYLLSAVLLGAAACTLGLLGSFYADWPTSPTILLCLGGVFLFSQLFGRYRSLLGNRLRAWLHPHPSKEIHS
ncbi:metal ABC transporter permease [Saccharospirillum sp. HFRX-1]|uniref:metal ABC transporter permease n=1 Tax=unclassified Saccharospirillum TaxID=2633430 RepID=UPI0037247770